MWPLLLTSIVSLAVVLERVWFVIDVKRKRQPKVVARMLECVERGRLEDAVEIGEKSQDYVARVLTAGLQERGKSLNAAILRTSDEELKSFYQGLPILDTAITLAPLLGLLATVTGMIHAFGLLGGKELDAPTVITGGIAEALIGTGFGLGIAIVALVPFNFLSAFLERARRDIENATTHLELMLKK